MSRHRRYEFLPAERLEPSWTPPDVDREAQVGAMVELRALSNQIAGSYWARDDRMVALALSQTLSRRDMAAATGLNKSRVDQILREHAEEVTRQGAAAAAERVRRHLPSGVVIERHQLIKRG